MKVVLSTTGRFHMFALARELEKHGVLEAIYSGFNWGALKRENVSRHKVRTFPFFRTPMMAMGRFGIKLSALSSLLFDISFPTLDAYVRMTMPDCDIFVGHEGAGLWSGAFAKSKGSIYVCDRGCSHAAWRNKLLEEEYDRVGLKFSGQQNTFNREIAEYNICDHIVVPSTFAFNSFTAMGIPSHKVSVVPYGVNLSMFNPVDRDNNSFFDVIFVGNLSVRKGAHDLFKAFELLDCPNKRLTIIGSHSDDIFLLLREKMDSLNIRSLGHVNQADLKYYLSNSDVMLLPSIEEGFGMVMAEAMACGCPVIATINTGAADLFNDGVEGFIVPIRNPEMIAEKLQYLAQNKDVLSQMKEAAIVNVESIGGWRDYGLKTVALYERLLEAR